METIKLMAFALFFSAIYGYMLYLGIKGIHKYSKKERTCDSCGQDYPEYYFSKEADKCYSCRHKELTNPVNPLAHE